MATPAQHRALFTIALLVLSPPGLGLPPNDDKIFNSASEVDSSAPEPQPLAGSGPLAGPDPGARSTPAAPEEAGRLETARVTEGLLFLTVAAQPGEARLPSRVGSVATTAVQVHAPDDAKPGGAGSGPGSGQQGLAALTSEATTAGGAGGGPQCFKAEIPEATTPGGAGSSARASPGHFADLVEASTGPFDIFVKPFKHAAYGVTHFFQGLIYNMKFGTEPVSIIYTGSKNQSCSSCKVTVRSGWQSTATLRCPVTCSCQEGEVILRYPLGHGWDKEGRGQVDKCVSSQANDAQTPASVKFELSGIHAWVSKAFMSPEMAVSIYYPYQKKRCRGCVVTESDGKKATATLHCPHLICQQAAVYPRYFLDEDTKYTESTAFVASSVSSISPPGLTVYLHNIQKPLATVDKICVGTT